MEPIEKIIKDLLAQGKSKEEVNKYIQNNYSPEEIKSFVGTVGKSTTKPSTSSSTNLSQQFGVPSITKEQKQKKEGEIKKRNIEAAEVRKNIIDQTVEMPDSEMAYDMFKTSYFDLVNRGQKWIADTTPSRLGPKAGQYVDTPMKEFLDEEKFKQWEEFNELDENGEIKGWDNVTPIDDENALNISKFKTQAQKSARIQKTQDLTRELSEDTQIALKQDKEAGSPIFSEKYGTTKDAELGLKEIENTFKISQQKLTNLAEEWEEKGGDELTKTLSSYQNTLKQLTGDDGVMDPLDSPARIQEYNELVGKYNNALAQYENIGLQLISNGIIKEQQTLETTLNDWQNKSKELDTRKSAEQAVGLDYSFLTRTGITLEEFFAGGAYNTALLTGQTYLKFEKAKQKGLQKVLNLVGLSNTDHFDPTEFDSAINYLSNTAQNYNYRLAANREKTLPVALKLDDIGRGEIDFFDWATDAFAENSGSLVTMAIPGSAIGRSAVALRALRGKALKNIGDKTVTSAYAKSIKAHRNLQQGVLRTAEATFFTAETGMAYGDIELDVYNAKKLSASIREQLKTTPVEDVETFKEYYDLLNEADRITNYSVAQKAFTSYLSGGIALLAERGGSLRFIRGTGDVIAKTGKKEFEKKFVDSGFNWAVNTTGETLSGLGKITVAGTTINLLEEGITKMGQNLTKIGILEEDISMFEGIDKDFFGNTIITTGGMIAPRGATHIINTWKSEVRTRAEVINNQKLIKELIDLNEESKNLKGDALTESLKKKRKIIKKLGLQDVLSLHKLRYLSPEEIKEVGEVNRRIRSIAADGYGNLYEIGDPNSQEYKDTKEKLDKQLYSLWEERDNILNKGKKYTQQQVKDLREEYKQRANNPQLQEMIGLLNFAHDLAISGLGTKGEYIVLTDEKKLDEQLSKYDKKTINNIKERFRKGDVYGTVEGNDIIIFEPTIHRIIATQAADASYAAIAPIEELFHLYNKNKPIYNDKGELKEDARLAIDQMIEMLRSKIGDKKQYEQLIARLNSYKLQGEKGKVVTKEGKRGEAQADYEELLTQIRNAVQLGLLDEQDFSEVPSLMQYINNAIKEAFGDASWIYQMNTPADVFKYIQRFNTSLKKGTISIEGTEEDERIDKESKVVSDKIDSYVGPLASNQSRYIMSKEEWDNTGINKAYRELIIGDALEPLINKGIFGQSIQGQSRETFVQSVKDKIADELIKFNPEVNNSLSGFINSRLGFRKGDVLKEIKKDKSQSLEDTSVKLQPKAEEGSIIVDEEKVASELRPALAIEEGDKVYDAVKQGVRDILKGKLPAPTDKGFVSTVNKEARDRLFDVVEKLVVGETDAIDPDFITQKVPNIIKALPVKDLVKLERLEKNKIFAKDLGRLSPTETDKAIAENKLPKTTNRLSGPRLWEKMPVTEEQLKNFFTQERKAALVGVIAENLIKDAMPETQLEPETKKRRKVAEQSQGRKTDETDRANILSVIDRDPYLKFSKAVLTPDQRIEFNKKGVNIVSGINNAIDNQGLSVFKATLFSLTENLRDLNIPQEALIKFAKKYAPAVKKFIKNLNKNLVSKSEFGKVTQEDVEKTLLSYALGDALGLSETAGSLFDNKKSMKKYDNRTHVEEFRRIYIGFALDRINKKGDLPGLIDILKFYKDFNTTAGKIGSGKGGTNRYQAFEGSKDFFDFINENLKDKGIEIIINKTGTGWVPVNIEINGVKQFENTKELNKVLKLRPQKNNLAESEIEKNYLLGEKEAGQAFDAMVDYLGYVKKNGDKAQFGMSLMALKSNMSALGKRVAYPKYFYVGKAKGPIRFEHMYPSLVLAKDMIDYFYSDKKVDLETIKKNQLVAMIPIEMDTRINILHQDSFPSWWNIKMGVLPRYYNALNKGYRDMYALKSLGGKDKGKIYGKEFLPLNKSIQKATISNKEKLPKLVKFSKAVINQEVLNEMAVLDTEQSEAQMKYSKVVGLNEEFNKILENKTGIGADKVYSDVKAQVVGANKGNFNFFVPPSAEDFVGLLYKTLGKGKLGDAQMAWYKKNLLDPFARAMDNISRDRIALMNDFKTLKKELKIVPKNLKKKLPGEPFTQEQAIRTYIWNRQGMSPDGMSKADLKELIDFVESKPELVAFADQLIAMQKGDQYPAPKPGWLAGNITTDLMDGINTIKRGKYLEQWQYNVDEIFSKANLNKLEAAYGKGYRTALESILKRMRTGRNREFTSDSLTGRVTDWLTNSIGAIMFFNTRSAVLQTISAANFINFEDNNIFAAGKAFANQPQFWKDFITLFNSDFLVDRRNGLRLNVNEADIADMAKKGGVRGVISELLRIGFLPTQIADSFAISSGGSTFYRNRIKKYTKEGMSKAEAENQAFIDFREIAEESQQSSRPDRISMQQAGPLGRVILAFANTPMQYTRLIKKAASDLKNGRGNPLTNISKIFYYGFVQNLFFNAMQQALFAIGFGDDEEETEKREEKYVNIVNSMADSILRGSGVGGAIFSVLKNTAIKLSREADKKSPKFQDVLVKEIAQLSPPISSKLSKLRAAGRSYSWNKKEMMEKGFSLDNPAYLAAGQVIAATTNVPLDRAFKKIDNIRKASSSDYEAWARIAMLAGWSDWELGVKKSESNKKDKVIY